MESNAPFVVIVDDVHENVRILHHCLKDDGYSFAVARNANELFELVARRSPTLILLDVMLPDLDGFSALERLRADPSLEDVPVIFVTARNEREDRIRGFGVGGVDYVAKPFDAAEVRARVRTHIALRTALEEQRRLNSELKEALEKVRSLEGIIPICARCKSVRNDEGYWTQVERYLAEHTNATFSHGLCPDCAAVLFPNESRDDGRR
jgi:DNA-binding response OmpR family regulator